MTLSPFAMHSVLKPLDKHIRQTAIANYAASNRNPNGECQLVTINTPPTLNLSTSRHANFLIVGAQKSGTTALADYLRNHPSIVLPDAKELHFFDHDRKYVRGAHNYDEYHAALGPVGIGQIVGEATPSYMFLQGCAERIFSYNPKIRLIFILRDPSERAYSQWCMQRHRGRERLSFGEAIRTETERSQSFSSAHEGKWCAYVARGQYAQQIKRYLTLFPREQLLFIRSERLMTEHVEALNDICDFLGVPAFDIAPQHHIRFSQNYEPMDPQDRKFLTNCFASSIRDLEDLLGWDCNAWLH